MSSMRQLYVWDIQPETAEVLRAVLGRSGTTVTEIHSREALESEKSTDSDAVLVLSAKLANHNRDENADKRIPQVVIGRNPAATQETPALDQSVLDPSLVTTSNQRNVDELFNYSDLVEAIESLWSRN